MRKAQTSTKIEFEALIHEFRVRDDQVTPENSKCSLNSKKERSLAVKKSLETRGLR